MVIHKRFDDDDDDNDIVKNVKSKLYESLSLSSGSEVPSKRNGIQPTLGVNKPGKASGGKRTSTRRAVSAQIRGLERLLKNKGKTLPENVQKAKQAQLAELQRLMGERGRRQSEFRVSKKYHMIRFFERRRLERILQRLEQKPESPEAVSEKAQTLRDLRYVNHFPKGRKYIALFPKGGHSKKSKLRIEAIRTEIDQLTPLALNTDAVKPGTEPDNNEDDFFLSAEGSAEE